MCGKHPGSAEGGVRDWAKGRRQGFHGTRDIRAASRRKSVASDMRVGGRERTGMPGRQKPHERIGFWDHGHH